MTAGHRWWELTLLSLAGGFLMMGEGVYLGNQAGQLSVAGLLIASAPLSMLGAFSFLAGAAICMLSAAYNSHPEYARPTGLFIVMVSGCAVWCGGGFWVGTIFGIISGSFMMALATDPRSRHRFDP